MNKFVKEFGVEFGEDFGKNTSTNDISQKTLSNTGPEVSNSDMCTMGDTGAWVVLCKAWSEAEGWMKSTKGMVVGDGVLIQVSTQQRAPDGSSSVAEALMLVPNSYMSPDGCGGQKIFTYG